ncbi:heparan-alpha-glucosaminide N-acetyltransferase [Patescibacteria group bacterium]
MSKDLNNRFWEIDFLRGIAIVSMVIFHAAFDLNYFDVLEIGIHGGFWSIFGKSVFVLFFVLVGISLSLSYSRAKITNKTNLFSKYLKRGLKVFFWGLIITLVTWIFMRQGFVLFGVLHFIGLSIILAYPLMKFSYANLFLGLVVIVGGLLLSAYSFSSPWLIWLGFKPEGFYSIDYFPILPYFGIILIGIFIGKKLYTNYERKFSMKNLASHHLIKSFSFLGKNSLLIYLIHQPILILMLLLFGVINI